MIINHEKKSFICNCGYEHKNTKENLEEVFLIHKDNDFYIIHCSCCNKHFLIEKKEWEFINNLIKEKGYQSELVV